MGWLKIDDDFLTNPKVLKAIAATDEGFVHFWISGTAYARKHLTDGHLAIEVIATFTRDRKPTRYADAAVAVGLWDRADGGYQIHDFLEFYESRSEVLVKLAKKKTQLRGWRARKKQSEGGVKSDFKVTSDSPQSDPGTTAKLLPESESESESMIPPGPPGGRVSPPSVSRDPDEIPEGSVDVVYIRAVRRAGAEPDVSQRERGQMAARWAEAQAEGVSWVRFCAWLDSWAFDWVSSTISAGKAEFNPGWPWKKFTNFVLAEEAKANGAVPNGESRIRPLTPAQVAARLAVSRGVAVPS